MSSYLGPGPVDTLASTQRTTHKFTGDGSRTLFFTFQQVPGAYESNLIVLVNNIIQEPEEAYLIEDAWEIDGSISGTFVLGETVTGGTSGATAIVTNITADYIMVAEPSNTFTVGETVSGASASIVVDNYTKEYGKTLKFTEAPDINDIIIAISLGSSTYQLQPSARSVGPEELQDNLREFSVDTFSGGSTSYTLSKEVVSNNAVLVTLDGIVQDGSNDYSISGNTLTFTSTVPAGVVVRVLFLGFTTSARRSVIDGAITTSKIVDGSITRPKIDDSGFGNAIDKNIHISDDSPTAVDGVNGDLWFEY